MTSYKYKDEPYASRIEEIYNSISHFVGAGLCTITYPLLIVKATNFIDLIGYIIYSTSLLLLYSISGIFHILKSGKWRNIFRILDHSAIYVLIAGSYTAYIIKTIPSQNGLYLLIFQWICVVVGSFFNVIMIKKMAVISPIFYLIMGWSCMVFISDIVKNMPQIPLILFFSMGICYSVGVIFYFLNRIQFTHFIFHFFVLSGSVLSFLSLYMLK